MFFFSSNKLSSLETYMNHDLDKFRVWAIANKLTVNPNKSHALIISPKCSDNMKSFNDIALNYCKSKILIDNCCKYSRILVDSVLNFAFHTKSIENKVARSIGIIRKLKHLLPTKKLLLLYHTIIHPHLLYGIQIRGDIYPLYLRNLIVLQNPVLGYELLMEANGMKELLNITSNSIF